MASMSERSQGMDIAVPPDVVIRSASGVQQILTAGHGDHGCAVSGE